MATAVATSTDAVLGQLVVRLVGDNADLLKRVKESEKSMKDFTTKAQGHFKAIAKAGTIAVGAVAGVAFAVQRMAAGATQIRSLSQSLGMTVEEFTALNFAVTQAGVPMEALIGSTIRLNQSITQIAQGIRGPAKTAFDQLGISVRDAQGNIRSTTDVLNDVADKFASFADGAEKSALAAQLFGEQGVKLLPVLNQGSEGLAKLAEEAKKAGVVLDTETVEKAAKVDREFKTMGETFKAAGIKISAEFLPAIRALTRLITSPQFQSAIKTAATNIAKIIEAVERISQFGLLNELDRALDSGINKRIAEIREELEALDRADQSAVGRFLNPLRDATRERLNREINQLEVQKEFNKALEERNRLEEEQLYGGGDSDKPSAPTIDYEAEQRLEEIKNAAKAAQQAALQELLDTPTETAVTKLEALAEALDKGTISWQEFGQMAKWVGKQQEQVMDDLLSTTAQTLTALFKDNKTAAIAASLINTYQAITKALSAYPPPYNMAMAAMVAAQGFAQVQAIRNTNKNGGGGGGGGVGSGGGAGAGGASGDEGGSAVPRSLFVQGINPRELYSGKVVADLAEVLLQFQRDGGTVLLDRKNS